MTEPSRVVTAVTHGLPAIQEGSSAGEPLPSKSEAPCWTCRRRRVQCDRLLPTCQKCQQSERECLGYKKPLVWNKGVASRGKMMGKTFEEANKSHQNSGSAWKPVRPQDTDDCGQTSRALSLPPIQSPFSIGAGVLVDPIFQDLKPLTRYYLDYYAQKLCAEAVLHDFPGQNPFRDLMALIGTSPLLLKTMLATAARHITNYNFFSTSSPSWSSLASTSGNQLQTASKSKYHALWYKQSALAQLREDLQQPSEINHNVIVASISLFVFIEMLESGKDTWRVHLDGVKQLVQSKVASSHQSLSINHGSEETSSPNLPTNSFFFDTCITFDIMGTTLARPYKITKPTPPTASVFASLQRSEKMSFVGCPADLLYLILVVNWQYWSSLQATNGFISNRELNSTAPEEIDDTSIIKNIQAFDPVTWALKTKLLTPHSDLSQRTHLASAYQSAVLIYAIRVICPALARSLSVTELASQVIQHLSAIPTDDPFFKCIFWPTFIAGTETNSSEQRDVIRRLFHSFWLVFRSANAANAAAVLEQIWIRADARKREAGIGGEDGGWIDYLVDGGVDWLFI